MENFLIIAHRGGHGPYEENTFEAFKHALDQGCQALEMDVRFDHLNKRFYLEHDFLHHPKKNRNNVMGKIIPSLPKNTFFFIELKTLSWLTKSYARRFLSEFDRFFRTENCVVMSFNPFVMMQIKKLAPKIRRGYLVGNLFWNLMFKKLLHRLINPHFMLLHKRLFSLKNVKFARAKGMKIMSFVLNDDESWQKALDYGIDGIITDRIDDLRVFYKKKVL